MFSDATDQVEVELLMLVCGRLTNLVPGVKVDWNPPATSRVPAGQDAEADPGWPRPTATGLDAVTSVTSLADLRQ